MRENTGSTLNTKLTVADIAKIQEILATAKMITLKGSAVVDTFINNSDFFKQAYNFLSYATIEGFSDVTYHDDNPPKGKLSIDVGFNLEQDMASNLLIAAKITPSTVYVKDQQIPPEYNDGYLNNCPKGGLSSDQAIALFRIILINDPSVEEWVCKAQNVQDILVKNGFGDIVFTGPEIIALQSLVYQEGNKLFGPGFIEAIKFYKQHGDPLTTAMQIIECSNKEHSVGIRSIVAGAVGS